jgi:hypothetical protein
MNFRAFYIVLICGILLLTWLQATPDAHPFKSGNESQRSRLDRLPAKDVATLKFNHTRLTGSVDIGVFGNSRSIQINKSSLSQVDGSFFNYSIPGSSFRQSVTIIEELAEANLLPRQVVISIDNLNLQYYANPSFPGALGRLRRAFNDISYGIQTPDISLHAIARMIRRHIIIEWTALTDIFNTNLLKERTSLSINSNNRPQTVRYGIDGSRTMKKASQSLVKNEYPSVKPNIIIGYLDYDLIRLSKVKKSGTNIIIYESPLFPGIKGKEAKFIRALRKHFLQTCKALSIDCHPAPILADNNNWGDESHAPVTLLGSWVSKLIEGKGQVSK